MKRIFIAIIGLFFALQSIVAQDVMITSDGDVMTVYIDDIGSSTIYYKTENSSAAQLQRIDKAKVYMIKKVDGTKIDLSNASNHTPVATTSATEQPMNTELSEEAKQRNKELIDALNKAAMLPEPVEMNDKSADFVFATLGVDNNSIICNDDIELSYNVDADYIMGVGSAFKSDFILTITNKTNKIIYIDLANTFLSSDGESSPYYVPVAYSSSTSKTGDANAGTFAGALGIHDYQTNVSTSTVYSQRIVSIPPLQQKRLNSKYMFPTRTHLCSSGLSLLWYKSGKEYCGNLRFYFGERRNVLKLNETFSFNQENSPLKFTCFVTYSFKEDCEVTNSISLSLFMNKVMGYYGGAWTGWVPTEKRISNYNSTAYIIGFPYSGNIEGTVFKRP